MPKSLETSINKVLPFQIQHNSDLIRPPSRRINYYITLTVKFIVWWGEGGALGILLGVNAMYLPAL